MSSRHILSLDIPVTTNPSILKIWDSSIYSNDLDVTCAILKIKSPGFINPVIIEVEPGFSLNLCACNLGIITQGCDTDYSPLPDGVYEIEYSVSPNDIVFVEYAHLRTVSIRESLYKEICTSGLSGCLPNLDAGDRIKEISLIETFIKGAEIMTSRCGDPVKGMEMLQYAKKRLDRYTCKDC